MKSQTYEIMDRLRRKGIYTLEFSGVNMLRRAQMTLHRWAEMECGDGNDYASWSIERDEETGIPYRCVYPHDGEMRKYRTPDRERGALKRVAEICAAAGIYFYHQGDPRGCSLYVSSEPITDSDYTRGVAVC